MLERSIPVNPPTVLMGQKAAISMWGLLVWAYNQELVRMAEVRGGDGAPRRGRERSPTARACDVLRSGILGPGHNGMRHGRDGGAPSFKVHDDAQWVHGLVTGLDRDEYWLVVRSAEAGVPPEWEPRVEPHRVEPVLRANGRPAMVVCPVAKRPVACRINVAGVSVERANAMRREARARYAQWHRLLTAMRDVLLGEDDGALRRWQVTGVGAPAEPWRPRGSV